MILLFATASCWDKRSANSSSYKHLCSEAEMADDIFNKKVFVWNLNALLGVQLWTGRTSSVSFVLDFSNASTLAWRLFTDAL